jgi:hypothetical protein
MAAFGGAVGLVLMGLAGGCGAVVAPLTAPGPGGEIQNEQGCPLTEPGRVLEDGWCRDDLAPLLTHPGATRCYRGYGARDGAQCCYDAAGNLFSDEQTPAAGSPDRVGPAGCETAAGACDWLADPLRVLRHFLADVLFPGLDFPGVPRG